MSAIIANWSTFLISIVIFAALLWAGKGLGKWFSFSASCCAFYIALMPAIGGWNPFSRCASYVLLLLLLAMCIDCVWNGRGRLLRGICLLWLVFYILLLLNAIRTEHPLVFFRDAGLVIVTLVAGMSLAISVRDLKQFRRDLLLIAAAIGSLLPSMYWDWATSDQSRLAVYGFNPNWGGALICGCLCITFYLAMWSKSSAGKWGGLVGSAALVPILVATGSRASFAAMVGIAIVCFLPLTKKLFAALFVATTLVGVVAFLVVRMQIEDSSRLTDYSLETGRAEYWAEQLSETSATPIFGNGTHFDEFEGKLQWANMHSVYVQVLYETGFVGAGVFALILIILLGKILRRIRTSRLPEKWLACALVVGPLVIGGAESLPLIATSLTTITLGFGLGLVDRLVEFREPGGAGSQKQLRSRRKTRVSTLREPAEASTDSDLSTGAPLTDAPSLNSAFGKEPIIP